MIRTKIDYQDMMLRMLNPLKRHYTPECAGVNIGATRAWYGVEAQMMESFSRPLWALGPYWHGGGHDAEFEQIARRGLTAGTDPENGEFWGTPGECDQRFVEMAAISCSIMLAPEVVWEPLSGTQKDNLAAYLYTINEHEQCKNNWQYFNVLTNLALRSVGRRYSPERMESALALIDTMYNGDGWYIDGTDGTVDYYNPFALHYYGLLYSVFNGENDPERAELFKSRAERFAQDFIYWFADNGAALPIGRSLTYRFAQSAFWSACIFAGVKPFSVGVMKGIISRNLEYWNSLPIYDNDDLLTIGYAYPNIMMAEHYNAPGSPYWAMKTFLVLALSDEHEFWSAENEPLPPLDEIHKIPAAGMIITRAGENVTAYTTGHYENENLGHTDAKYGKFAYSTVGGFSVPYSSNTIFEAAPDNMTAFAKDGHIFVKRRCIRGEIEGDNIVIDWSPIKGIDVHTTIIPQIWGHKRITEVTSDCECVMYECGTSIEYNRDTKTEVNENSASIFTDGVESSVQGSSCNILHTAQNTNILYPDVLMPYARYEVKTGTQKFETEFIYKKGQ